MNLPAIRQSVDRRLAAHNLARAQCKQEKLSLVAEIEKLNNHKDALVLAQIVAQQVQEQAHARIADVVSRALESVFDDPYKFKIAFEQARGRTQAVLTFDRDGVAVDPMTASGGGVVDLAAFALRMSCLLLSRPPVRRLLVLDEPFKFISAEYRGRVRKMLEVLSKELEVQLLIVTHIEELKTGTIVQL